MMDMNYELLLNFSKSTLDYSVGKKEKLTLQTIINTVNELAKISNKPLEKNLIQKCIDELQSKYASDPGHTHCLVLNPTEYKWYDDIKDSIKQEHWQAYRNHLLVDKCFSVNVVNQLGEETLDKYLMNTIGNPKSENAFLNRGLVIGDVQSGKTSTYLGLICKAADVGYRLFIVLTGTIENLRSQTQQRIEEGFIGRDIANDNVPVGVGVKSNIVALTSRESDFVNLRDHTYVPMENNDLIGVLVIKKNKTILKRVKNWLNSINSKNIPLLVIDDEADNASINTKDKDYDPTIINSSIRKILDSHAKATYVGVTATPFANLFIDPVREGYEENYDLFPEDFVVSLPTSSEYTGATKFFDEDRDEYVRIIDDVDESSDEDIDNHDSNVPFKYKHKKEWKGKLPNSLTKSIYAFYLANAIKDLDDINSSHRTMLINISRYINVQKYVKDEIVKIHKASSSAIKYSLSYDFDLSMKNEIIKNIYDIWCEEYKEKFNYTWEQIIKVLDDAIKEIKIVVVNSQNKKERLDFNGNPIRAIAIGGLALSRGLTLEGLIISYFYRNTSTYDVLMQMGRWFGYRNKDMKVIRIWISERSVDWYSEINKAIIELKNDVQIMMDKGKKPRDYGVRVRHDSEELKITSSNKMRNSHSKIVDVDIFGISMETAYLIANPKVLENNYNVVNEKLKIWQNQYDRATDEICGGDKGNLYVNISKREIISLLKNLEISELNQRFDIKEIVKTLNDTHVMQLESWDVMIMTGQGKEISLGNQKYNAVVRNSSDIISKSLHGSIIKIGLNGKVGGSGDGKCGIPKELAKKFLAIYNEKYSKNYESYNKIPSSSWFTLVDNRKPLLIIYPLDIRGKNIRFEDWKKSTENIIPMGFFLGVPRKNELTKKYCLKNHNEKNQTYVYNSRINYAGYDDMEEGEE